ncbi:cellulose synthase (UDP-forming) [Bradyrhizobium sp. Rc3b]|uniref:glycosyltransferase n=1 Tax=unclassified Bradyrhizobium TaxID=2631580 RepID=UPI0008EBD747|nr:MULTISPECIES: glycosyltransferase [unclassified Bradyrhizobium]MBB4379771.1 cellulose synthase (UDP-forming) [Bradyrhizobium sp. SBR1B]SFN59460.1 cellulose synthase (UDP-forming) [Bradyrhizobium sp. Rc3b]
MTTALTPGLIALGAFMAIVPLLRRDSTMARSFLAIVSLVFLLRYLHWRVTATLPPPHLTADAAVGYPFMLLEAASLVAVSLSLLFLSRTIDRSRSARIDSRAFDPGAPLIDVFICTYNEERSILERTIIGATGMTYGNYRVWVLDDGRRPWLRRLSGELGCHYLTRPDNHHAKAGNINHALRHVGAMPKPPQFVAILDADFVPRPDFLARTISLMDDASVGVVQTPQHFINPDPIQSNLAATDVWPDEQRFFFDILLPAKDAWGVAFCCGTSSLIRYDGLVRIGGFPTDSVTEDYLVTLRLKERGLNTIYLNERLTIGLAPEGLKEYITQRARWCLGLMQIVRGRSGPLSRESKLSFIDRLSLVDAFMSWSAVYTSKVAGLVVPWLFLLFGIKAVRADLSELLRFFLPFYVWHSLSMAWLSHGRSLAMMTDVSQLIAAPAVLKAVATGLLKPKGHKFKVTAKGGDRDRRFVEWPLLRLYGTALLVTLAAIAYAFILHLRGENIAYGGLALAWSLYNAFILTVVCFVCIEQPRKRKAERFDRNETVLLRQHGKSHLARLADISITGARLIDPDPPHPGSAIECRIYGRPIAAVVVRQTADGFAVRFEEGMDTRVHAIRAFYAGEYVRAYQGVRALPVGKALLMRLFG